MDYSANEEIIEGIWNKTKYLILPSKENNYQSKFLQSRVFLGLVILLLFLKVGTVIISINFPQNIFFADITKIALQNFANQARQEAGLPALSENQKLDAAAQMKAENMVSNNYFNHVSPTGITPWHWFLQAGYNYKYAGENLAIGFFDSKEVFNAWLNSPTHKDNILNPNYKEVGTAVLSGFGTNNAIVVVQEFGSPMPIEASKPIEKPSIEKPNEIVEKAPNAKVLSQTTQSESIIESPKSGAASSLFYKALNLLIYNYDDLLKKIIYGFSLLVIGILITIIFLKPDNIEFKKEFVFRSVLIVGLLSLATLINRETIILIIPHQIII